MKDYYHICKRIVMVFPYSKVSDLVKAGKMRKIVKTNVRRVSRTLI